MNESVLDQIDFQREGFDAALTLELLFFLQCWFPQMAFHVLVQHAEHRKFFLAVFTLKRFVSWMNCFKMILQVVWLHKQLVTLWAWICYVVAAVFLQLLLCIKLLIAFRTQMRS